MKNDDDVAAGNMKDKIIMNDPPTKYNERQKLKQLKTSISIPHDLFQNFIDEYIKIKYNHDENKIKENLQKEIEDMFFEGFLQKKKSLTTSSTSLLFDNKPARRDVKETLGKISKEFLNCPTFPEIHIHQFMAILNKVLASKDERTIKKYKKNILQYCNFYKKLGIIDVLRFVQKIPKCYLCTE